MLIKWTKRFVLLVVFVLLGVLGTRVYDIQSQPALQRWHTFVPHEMRAKEIDKASWQDYINAENRLFEDVRVNVTDKLALMSRSLQSLLRQKRELSWPFCRRLESLLYPETARPAERAVVLLHGLTDSPYSMRHIAINYQQHGYVAIGIRLPAHGTVPGALTDVDWQDWAAATRLAVREAKALTAKQLPLHLVGYSNGGALALKYALDALDDPMLAKPQQVILISPMIGITAFARFAGVAGWPAVFPAFAKAAWLGIVPNITLLNTTRSRSMPHVSLTG